MPPSVVHQFEIQGRSEKQWEHCSSERKQGRWTGVFMDNREMLQSLHKSIKQPTFHHILETHDLRKEGICLESIPF